MIQTPPLDTGARVCQWYMPVRSMFWILICNVCAIFSSPEGSFAMTERKTPPGFKQRSSSRATEATFACPLAPQETASRVPFSNATSKQPSAGGCETSGTSSLHTTAVKKSDQRADMWQFFEEHLRALVPPRPLKYQRSIQNHLRCDSCRNRENSKSNDQISSPS